MKSYRHAHVCPLFPGGGWETQQRFLVVNFGDDADTTGAVYGQLAGAFYGEREIPEFWRSRLTLHHLIVSYAQQLLSISNTAPGR